MKETPFNYTPLRKKPFKIRYNNLVYALKLYALKFIGRTPILKKILNSNDRYFLFKQTNKTPFYNLDSEANIYADISLEKSVYFLPIEIDQFHRFEKKILRGYNQKQFLYSTSQKNELRKRLSEIKYNFDSISSGHLFSINKVSEIFTNDSLIKMLGFSYIKTSETYFVLKINVYPSEKFENLFMGIISSMDVSVSTDCFNSFYDIIKTHQIYSHSNEDFSLKQKNLKELANDLDYQLNQILNKFFSRKTKNLLLKSKIELYLVDNIHSYNDDKRLNNIFTRGFYSFILNDGGILINLKQEKGNNIIIKQKGHGSREQNSKDFTNYDSLENDYLLSSLTFPIMFLKLLENQTSELNTLKRKIYDFSILSNSNNLMDRIKFLFVKRRFIVLKQRMNIILLASKRFEREHSNSNMSFYTGDFDLNNFKRIKNTDENLNDYFKKSIHSNFQDLKSRTHELNDIFKSIEELNSYRTNVHLQRITIFIAIVALIVVKEFRILLYDCLQFIYTFTIGLF